MKRLFLLVSISLFTLLPLFAQSWADKAAKSVFTVKTFAADGTMIASSNGFFVGNDGEAVSNFAPFVNAARAIIIDAQGNEQPVEEILGANETYDVIKFRVAARKTQPLPIATTATNGSQVWLLPYSVKNTPVCIKGTISQAEKFQDTYQYYTLLLKAEDNQISCPVLNDKGEVIGMIQPASDSKKDISYAVSARFAADLKMSGLSMNEESLKKIIIAKALPDNTDEALLALILASSTMTESQYSNYLERFIQKFPNVADGYIYRARLRSSQKNFSSAEADMEQALKVADNKAYVHYQYAQLIFQKEVYQSDQPYSGWSFEKAYQEAQEAYNINPMPVCRQQQAQIRYAQGQYADAFNIYEELTHSDIRSADIFFAASQCKAQLGETDQQIALLDSAVNMFSRPYVKTAAPYILARAQALYAAKKYRPAITDYNEYGELMAAQLDAPFYYQREQAEVDGHLYQQALNDIDKAIELEPSAPLYYAEKASLLVRVGKHQDAITTAQQLIRLSPDFSDGYLFLGLAQCLTNQKAEGIKNLTKAKDLGNAQAQTLIEKYAK